MHQCVIKFISVSQNDSPNPKFGVSCLRMESAKDSTGAPILWMDLGVVGRKLDYFYEKMSWGIYPSAKLSYAV